MINVYIWNLERRYRWPVCRQQWRHRHREQACGHSGEGDGGTKEESNMETYMLPYAKQRARGDIWTYGWFMWMHNRNQHNILKHILWYVVVHVWLTWPTQSCLTPHSPMDCSMPGFPVLQCLPEFTRTLVHWVDDALQPSHPVVPFSSCLQSLPASRSFLMSQFFPSGGQSKLKKKKNLIFRLPKGIKIQRLNPPKLKVQSIKSTIKSSCPVD